MADEAHDLGEALIHTARVVAAADTADRERIRAAYDAGLQLIAQAAPPGTCPRPGIEACILRHEELRAAGDVACAGWVLAAISARVEERDLSNWESFKSIIDAIVQLLSRPYGFGFH